MLNPMSRRQLLSSAIPAAGAFALAGCTTTTDPTTGATSVTLDPSVIQAIQTAVSAAVKYIPAVESILSTAASLFGPAYAAVVTFGSNAVNTVISALIGVVTKLTPAAAAKLGDRLMVSAPGQPVVIGVTRTGVQVLGYRV